MTPMTQTEDRPTAADRRATFDSLNPATGDVVGTHPVHTEDEVRAAVARAREAAAWWSALSYDERERHLLTSWKGVITRRIAAARRPRCTRRRASRTATRCSRPRWPSTTSPGPPATPRRCSRRRRVSSGLVMANQAATRGVPPARRDRRDRPVELPGLHADGLDRLRAGGRQRRGLQAQRVHPRRRRVAGRARFREVVGRPVLQVVTGLGETGAALCRAGVDKVAFTGSTATGKRVMAACAETLTPVIIEAGGKDARARRRGRRRRRRRRRRPVGRVQQRRPDLHRRRAGLRPRAGVRRVPRRADRKARELRADDDPDAQIGPITMPKQLDVIRSHIQDALDRGGRARRRRAGRGRASGSCSRRSWSTCPRTPPRCRRRPSARR